MIKTKGSPEKHEYKKKLGFFFEAFGWLSIVASPFLIGLIIGFAIYLSNPSTTRIIIAVAVALAGLVTGVIWATKIWKKKGTLNFISKIHESPDLDYLDEDNEN